MQTDTVTKNKQRILDNLVSPVLNIVHNQPLIYWSCAALICCMDYNRVIIRCSVLYIFRSAPGTRRKIKARMHSCFNRQRILFLFCRETICFYNVARGTKEKKTRPTSKIKFPFFQSFDVGYKYDFPYLTFDWFFFLWNFWTWYINCPPTFYYQDTNVRISHIRNAFSTLQTFAQWIEINAGHNMYKTLNILL